MTRTNSDIWPVAKIGTAGVQDVTETGSKLGRRVEKYAKVILYTDRRPRDSLTVLSLDGSLEHFRTCKEKTYF